MADVEGLIAEIRAEVAEQIAAMQGQLASAMSEITAARQAMEKPTQNPVTQAQEQAQKGQSSEEWRGAMDQLYNNVSQQMLTMQSNLTQFQGTMSTEMSAMSVMMGTNMGHTEDLNRAQSSRMTGVKEKLQTDENVAMTAEDRAINTKLTGAENAIVEMRPNLTQFQGTMSTEMSAMSVMMGTNMGHTEDLNRAQSSRMTGVKEKLQTDENVAMTAEDRAINTKLTGAENAIVEMRLEELEAAVYVDSIDATMITGCPDFSL